MTPIEVRLERGGALESTHLVHAFIAGDRDRAWGDPELLAFWRSSMKPFQALPLVEESVLSDLGLGSVELAIACASHDATRDHVAAAGRILAAAGASEDDLACGPHRPHDPDAAKALDLAGVLPGRIHNNCSGKHAGMVAWALREGVDPLGYHTYEHPVQVRVREALSRWLDFDPEDRVWGVDGCGVPTPRISLTEMAAAYARLAGSEEPAALAVVSAMTKHPIMVSGATALSSCLMAATGGRLVAKEGAEGVFCVAERGTPRAAAFKVADGAMRAMGPAVLHALARAGWVSGDELESLASFTEVTISNTRDEPVARLVVGSVS